MAERRADVGIISEPNNIPKSVNWIPDRTGLAVVVWSSQLAYPCVLRSRGYGFVAVDCGGMVIVSCYFSPNLEIDEYDAALGELADCVRSCSGSPMVVTLMREPESGDQMTPLRGPST
ncbi:uncharacterized protein LOC105189486 [Harpegnathos saltator]|uniref:uncharacterized protein LOC105189486 n=1 Tax=Harpegnathos saltator TaxID=610380 RepID=UPI00058D8A15|nr:uncharacterized protein LOC105189486 [Harpegnathos saltator]